MAVTGGAMPIRDPPGGRVLKKRARSVPRALRNLFARPDQRAPRLVVPGMRGVVAPGMVGKLGADPVGDRQVAAALRTPGRSLGHDAAGRRGAVDRSSLPHPGRAVKLAASLRRRRAT